MKHHHNSLTLISINTFMQSKALPIVSVCIAPPHLTEVPMPTLLSVKRRLPLNKVHPEKPYWGSSRNNIHGESCYAWQGRACSYVRLIVHIAVKHHTPRESDSAKRQTLISPIIKRFWKLANTPTCTSKKNNLVDSIASIASTSGPYNSGCK